MIESSSRSASLRTKPNPRGARIPGVGRGTPPPPAFVGYWRRMKADPASVVMFLVLLAVALVTAYPFLFMIVTSFKTQAQYTDGSGFSVAAWRQLLSTPDIGIQLLNSGFVTISAIAIILVCSSAAGYAFAKLPFRGHSVAFFAVIGCLMIPVHSIIIPVYINFAGVHLINNYLSAILLYAALGTPFGTFLMTSFFRGLPDELIDAGLCDGLGRVAGFWRLALPLAKPALTAVAVLQFILIWNDLLVGLLFLQTPALRTITVGIGVLASGNHTSLSLLMAAAVISSLPALVVYTFLQ